MKGIGFSVSVLAGIAGFGVAVAVANGDGPRTDVAATPNSAATASPSPKVVEEKAPRAIHLLITSQLLGSGDHSRIVGPTSFCAPPNGEPVALACGGRVRAPQGPKVPVQPGRPILLRFGTAADRVWVRYERATKGGRVIALTYATPIRSSSNGGLIWRSVMPHDSSLRRSGTIAVFSVAYRDGIRLPLPDRMTKPFHNATAEFAVPLRPRSMHTQRDNRKWAETRLPGLSEAAAKARAHERSLTVRVVRRNHRNLFRTDDRIITRINVEVVNGRVTRVVGLF